MQLAMVDDRIQALEDLHKAYQDRGLFFGDGVYEVLRSYQGRIFALDEHLQRFEKSLAAIDINGVDLDMVRRRIERAFEAAEIANAKIYFHITRGAAPRSHLEQPDMEPTFLLTVTKLEDDTHAKTNGIAVSTHPDWRWKKCDIKSLNLLPNVLARRNAAKKDCYEAILVDEAGLITEGAGSAFFAIFGRSLHTAPLAANILPSITRAFVIQAARNISLQLREQSILPTQAKLADELFIAVTTQDIIPVVKFDEQTIANGAPGPFTQQLISEFRKFTHKTS
ncbi:MAG: aminotransferase class IV [Sedimentisphaerales bacterium]|nr:aminotransferase class IV [Sedimentisphaerales bacterium]